MHLKHISLRTVFLPGVSALLAAVVAVSAVANEHSRTGDPSNKPRWTLFSRGGYVHQFESDLDDGGDFDVDRIFVQGGVSYSMGPRRRVSLAVGFGRDHYDFSGSEGIAALAPWERINQLRLSAPVFWAVDERWTVFFIPTVRFFAETGTDFEDSGTGGVLAAFSYRFSDTLTLGPGLGVLGKLEDNASIFPILIVDWKITDRLTLGTGRGLGATQGAGLTLSYQATGEWKLGLGGRRESLRFRLNDNGTAPGGVGEDKSFPLFASATYSQGRALELNLLGGVELGGKLRLEDSKGRKISKESYDAAPFLGFSFNYRF